VEIYYAQWAWKWHYRFIHFTDQQDAAYLYGRADLGRRIGALLVLIVEDDQRLLEILTNVRSGRGIDGTY